MTLNEITVLDEFGRAAAFVEITPINDVAGRFFLWLVENLQPGLEVVLDIPDRNETWTLRSGDEIPVPVRKRFENIGM